jgi:hypothetical protein
MRAAVKDSGRLIQELVVAKRLRPRDVETKSRSIAEAKANPEFYISHATLNAIMSGSTPSIYKVFTLAACCGVSYGYMLSLFGIEIGEAGLLSPTPPSVNSAAPDIFRLQGPNFRFCMNFDVRVIPKETTLLLGQPSDWVSLPADLISRLEPRRFLYALIGLDDDSMAEIIPPGSLVEIDKEQTRIVQAAWRTPRERPIYLIWHEHGYSCCWCEIARNELLLVPHPFSSRPILVLKTPSEASVIGRIIHVWCSLGSASSATTNLRASSSLKRF